MSSHHNEHKDQNDENQENHDDCDDCKKERAQNNALIEIYEKLQEIDKKKSDIKSSLNSHQHQFQLNQTKVKKFDQKLSIIKNNKNNEQQTQFEKIGYDLLSNIYQKNRKGVEKKQNERLKLLLKNIINKQQNNEISQPEPSNQNSKMCLSLNYSDTSQWFTPRDKSRGESRNSSFKQTDIQKSFEIFSTKSSFNMTKRKSFDKKDFQDLNLWLFQDKNEILEKQLYQKNKAFYQSNLSASIPRNLRYQSKQKTNQTFSLKRSPKPIFLQKNKLQKNSKLIQTSNRANSFRESYIPQQKTFLPSISKISKGRVSPALI